MKNKIFLLSLLLVLFYFSLPSTHAQVNVTVELNRKNYLLFETVFANVYLRNYSGHPLVFGKNAGLDGQLTFEIMTPDGSYATKLINKNPPLLGTIIKPGATHKVLVPVSRYYSMLKQGNYTLKAVLTHKNLDSRYVSKVCSFTVSQGIPIWKRQVGVPVLVQQKTNSKIKTRTYRIVSTYDGKFKVFYLIVEDKKYIYSVKRLGYEIGSAPPSCEIDALSRLHVLLKDGPKLFSYYVFDLDGSLFKKDRYRKGKTSPVLVRDPEEGTVSVAGGNKALKDVDYQEEKEVF